jgi:hypothetical protein
VASDAVGVKAVAETCECQTSWVHCLACPRRLFDAEERQIFFCQKLIASHAMQGLAGSGPEMQTARQVQRKLERAGLGIFGRDGGLPGVCSRFATIIEASSGSVLG